MDHFAYVYNEAAQTVVSQGDVTFDTNGPSSGVTHAVGAAMISVGAAGSYLVDLSVTGAPAGQFALMVNGVAAPRRDVRHGRRPATERRSRCRRARGGRRLDVEQPHEVDVHRAAPSGTTGEQPTVNASVLVQRLG